MSANICMSSTAEQFQHAFSWYPKENINCGVYRVQTAGGTLKADTAIAA